MAQETFLEKQEENLAVHIFSVSAAMVGVCITVVGIINIISSFDKLNTWADEITVLDAIIFLSSCIFSYTAIKTKDKKRRLNLEKMADIYFLTGLSVMVLICVFFVFKLV